MQWLVAQGAYINAVSDNGSTALHGCAAIKGHVWQQCSGWLSRGQTPMQKIRKVALRCMLQH
jgi:hypothetical protein